MVMKRQLHPCCSQCMLGTPLLQSQWRGRERRDVWGGLCLCTTGHMLGLFLLAEGFPLLQSYACWRGATANLAPAEETRSFSHSVQATRIVNYMSVPSAGRPISLRKNLIFQISHLQRLNIHPLMYICFWLLGLLGHGTWWCKTEDMLFDVVDLFSPQSRIENSSWIRLLF